MRLAECAAAPLAGLRRLTAGRGATIVSAALVVMALAGSLAYWPGLMIWDSARQYHQALSGQFDDWHPPAMEAVWRLWTFVAKGPAPMLAMQLAIYGAGLALLVHGALKRREGARAMTLAATALLPLTVAMMGEVIKDSLMTALLVLAVGLWIGTENGDTYNFAWPPRWRSLRSDWKLYVSPFSKAGAAALIVAAATLRYNAFLAGAPLLVALAPAAWRDRWFKLAGLAAAAGALLLVVTPLSSRLLGAQKSGVELSLTIFDLGGIGRYSGQDVFPPLKVAAPVAVNHRCYRERGWDSYAMWVDPICPINFDGVRAAVEQQHISQRLWWVRAIVSHPIAYARHRLGHWNVNTRFLVHRAIHRPVEMQSDPNDGNWKVPQWRGVAWVDRLARWSALTPLGWPACWLAFSLGLAILAPVLPSRRWVMPLALSGLVYGLGYAVVSVATDLRYYLWTMAVAAIAAAIAFTDKVDWRAIDRRRLVAAGAPLAVVATLSVLWRIF